MKGLEKAIRERKCIKKFVTLLSNEGICYNENCNGYGFIKENRTGYYCRGYVPISKKLVKELEKK